MDLNKSREFFDPQKVKAPVHIIGCGSIGSNVAELLARYGITKMTLWDFDTVERHNIANQIFTEKHVGRKKTECLKEILVDINPDLMNTVYLQEKYIQQPLEGFVFLCVDSVDVRNQIVDAGMYNSYIKGMFDFRTTLMEGQCFYANWSNPNDRQNLKNSMNFTHEEAKENAEVSACGFELSVSPVVKSCALMGVANFTNIINGLEPKKLIITRPYSYELIA